MNHAHIPDIVQRFAQMPWKRPQAAQLMIRDQEKWTFRLWMIRDGHAQQYAPLPEHGEDDLDEDPAEQQGQSGAHSPTH